LKKHWLFEVPVNFFGYQKLFDYCFFNSGGLYQSQTLFETFLESPELARTLLKERSEGAIFCLPFVFWRISYLVEIIIIKVTKFSATCRGGQQKYTKQVCVKNFAWNLKHKLKKVT
jgi:hypothetical protein